MQFTNAHNRNNHEHRNHKFVLTFDLFASTRCKMLRLGLIAKQLDLLYIYVVRYFAVLYIWHGGILLQSIGRVY